MTAQELAQVFITATRLASGVDPASSNVDVIGPDQIAARHAASVADLIGDLPGVFVQQAGGRGGVTSAFTRGAQPNFTLVLIDGVRANDPTNSRGGSFDFSGLGMGDIERIEIVRGPASAIHGADALGGVINIITRKGREPALDAFAEGGSLGYRRAQAHAQGSLGRAVGAVGVAHDDSGEPVDGSAARTNSVNGSLQLPVGGFDVNFSARYGSTRATAFPDSSGGPLLAVYRTLDRRRMDEGLVGLRASRRMATNWTMIFDYGLHDRETETRSPGVAPSAQTPTGIPPNLDDASFRRHQLTFTNQLTLSRVDLAVGLAHMDERGSNAGYLEFGTAQLPTSFALDRATTSAFVEMRYAAVPNGHISLSGRIDRLPGGNWKFSPAASADYSVASGTRLDARWGKAFKLPSFYALGNPIVGDPDLRPERASNAEVGVGQALGRSGDVRFTGFSAHYRNLIDFQPGEVPRLVNRTAVRIRGVEASLTLNWQELSMRAHVSRVDARDTSTGAALRDVPRWLAGGNFTWTPGTETTLNLKLSEVGPLTGNAVPTGDMRLADHFQADLALSRRLGHGVTVHLGIDNLFNSRGQQIVGFPGSGTAVRIGVGASR